MRTFSQFITHSIYKKHKTPLNNFENLCFASHRARLELMGCSLTHVRRYYTIAI
ncbi:hypothetical protein F157LOC_00235 [Pectobacterium brasiliense]|nr:hypothetical protein F152LOC_02447 [Pectobacterium brasiliense]PPE61412.1 hypothetical protein F157LOC_00235 [Pectobacterium brasiliense]